MHVRDNIFKLISTLLEISLLNNTTIVSFLSFSLFRTLYLLHYLREKPKNRLVLPMASWPNIPILQKRSFELAALVNFLFLLLFFFLFLFIFNVLTLYTSIYRRTKHLLYCSNTRIKFYMVGLKVHFDIKATREIVNNKVEKSFETNLRAFYENLSNTRVISEHLFSLLFIDVLYFFFFSWISNNTLVKRPYASCFTFYILHNLDYPKFLENAATILDEKEKKNEDTNESHGCDRTKNIYS